MGTSRFFPLGDSLLIGWNSSGCLSCTVAIPTYRITCSSLVSVQERASGY